MLSTMLSELNFTRMAEDAKSAPDSDLGKYAAWIHRDFKRNRPDKAKAVLDRFVALGLMRYKL